MPGQYNRWVSRWGTRIAALLATAALLAFAGLLCGCGSGSNSDSTATGASGETETTGGGGQGDSGKSQPSEPKDAEGKGDRGAKGSAPVSPLKVSGGGSGQFRVKGGDNSIQEFGEESTESELDEAAVALHALFAARAEEDWRAACARLSKTVKAQLRLLGEHSKSKSGPQLCPARMAALTPTFPIRVQRESTIVDAGSLRVEGDRGFLIYRGAGGTVYAINMAEEGGWKVASLAGVPLS